MQDNETEILQTEFDRQQMKVRIGTLRKSWSIMYLVLLGWIER